jgi:3-methyladenine DNA glycosylase/8-oxoguanine DNA glycosylase
MSTAWAFESARQWAEARCRVGVFPIHFARTFSMQSLGPYDPTANLRDDCFRKAFYYRGNVAAIEICRDGDGLAVCAYGADAQQLLDETVAGLTQDDRYTEFAVDDRGILRLHSAFPGMRLLRFPWLYDMTCSAILQQRIRTVDAMRDWRRITHRWGGPGPWNLRAFPPAEVLAAVPRFELERMGIDAKRAAALLRFAKELRFVRLGPQSDSPSQDFATLRQQLLRVPGIGGWTTETVLGYGAGDTDAAIPADLHLPRVICYALAGEFKGTDERMMELLEPFRGHRFRVIRLIYASGLDTPW